MSESLELKRKRAMAIAVAKRRRDQEEEDEQGQPLSPSGQPLQKGQTHFVNPETGRTEKLPEEMQPSKEEMIEGDTSSGKWYSGDPASGVMYGMVEGVPFAKDAMSAGKAAYEAASGKGENFGEAYQSNMDQWNKEINLAEEKHPALFTASDIGVGIAAFPALKGLKGLGAAVMFGGASSLSRSEERGASDFLLGASLGASGDLLGKGVARFSQSNLMQGIGKKLGIVADDTTADIISVGDNKKELNAVLNKIYKTFNPITGKVSVPSPRVVAAQFADDLGKIKVRGASLIDPSDNLNTIVMKFRHLHDDVDDTIGNVLKNNDIDLDEKQVELIYKRHKAALGLDDMRASGSADAIKQADELEEKLINEYFDEVKEFTYVPEEVPILGANGQPLTDNSGSVITKKISKKVATKARELKKTTLLDLHSRKRFYSQKANMDAPLDSLNQTNQAYFKKGSGVLSDEIPELLQSGSDELRHLNKISMIARIGKKLTQKTNDTIAKGALDKLKQAFDMRATLMIAGGAAGGGATGATVGFAVSQLSRAGKDPTINSKAAHYIRKVATAIQNGTDGAYIKRLAVASSLSTEEFGTAIAGIASEVSLMESPIKRTYADIEDKSDFILEALQYHDPKQADQLRNAFDSNDKETIRAIMDQVSKNPDMALMFEDGRGIDGRVFSEEDKQALRDEVESMDISLKQKLQHLDQLNKQGLVPQVEEEPERFLKFEKRDKSKPSY